jgi:hypothetical protein
MKKLLIFKVCFVLKRFIWFMSDICHLIKTARNCWENSSKKGTRHLEVSDINVQNKSIFSYYRMMENIFCGVI